MSNEFNILYEFMNFRFDGKKGKLWQDDELILLSPKASDLLKLLLEQNGEFVSKEKIFETVWADTFVEDGVLTQNIYTLRKVLGKDADGQLLIENKTRLGYRITVSVNLISDEPQTEDTTTIDEIIFDDVGTPEPNPQKRNWKRVSAVLIFGAILLSTTGFFSYRFFGSSLASYFRKPIETVKFSKLTNTGDLSEAALSPDGKFLAFVRKNKVYLKDIVSDKEIPLEIPNVSAFGSLQFSVDGNFLYFCDTDTFLNYSKILKVSRFGGDSMLVTEQNLGRFALSPDNKFVAFYTVEMPNPHTKLVVKNLETQENRKILEFESNGGYCIECSPAWSPDGKKIIHINEQLNNLTNQLFVLNAENGEKEEIKLPKLRRLRNAFWFPDGESFAVSASSDDLFHLWKVYYPNGDVQQITNGLDSYENPIISADGKTILTLQKSENANIFVADDADLVEQKQLTSGNPNNFGKRSLIWADDRNILFSAQMPQEQIENFWLIDSDGEGKRQITNEKNFRPNRPSSDGKYIYFNINRNKVANISKIDSLGGNRTDITDNSDGSRGSPQVSPDGNWLYYTFRNKTEVKIMQRNLVTQQEEVFLENKDIQCGFFLEISPDGKFLACPTWRVVPANNDKKNSEILLMSIEDRAVIKSLQISRSAFYIRFSPDSQSIQFINESNEGSKIMLYGFDESEPKRMLQLPKDYIFNFAWSKNGKQLAVSRGQRSKDAVILPEFDK